MFMDDGYIQVEEEAALINYYLNSKKEKRPAPDENPQKHKMMR
jgi:hypothetical protein